MWTKLKIILVEILWICLPPCICTPLCWHNFQPLPPNSFHITNSILHFSNNNWVQQNFADQDPNKFSLSYDSSVNFVKKKDYHKEPRLARPKLKNEVWGPWKNCPDELKLWNDLCIEEIGYNRPRSKLCHLDQICLVHLGCSQYHNYYFVLIQIFFHGWNS